MNGRANLRLVSILVIFWVILLLASLAYRPLFFAAVIIAIATVVGFVFTGSKSAAHKSHGSSGGKSFSPSVARANFTPEMPRSERVASNYHGGKHGDGPQYDYAPPRKHSNAVSDKQTGWIIVLLIVALIVVFFAG